MRFFVLAFFLYSMQVKDCYKIGFIMKTHGLKGEVTASLDPEAPDNFEDIDALFVEQNDRLIPYFIQGISITGNKAFLKLEDVDSLEAATSISKSSLYLPKSTRAKSAKGEFYDDEIIGFEVTDSEQGLLGKVIEVTIAGSNKLLSVDHHGKEILIPINSPFITSINKSKKKVSVTLPEGFLDI